MLVTSRPHEKEINFALQALDPWKLAAGRPENMEDIRKYLHHELSPFTGNRAPSVHLLYRGQTIRKVGQKPCKSQANFAVCCNPVDLLPLKISRKYRRESSYPAKDSLRAEDLPRSLH